MCRTWIPTLLAVFAVSGAAPAELPERLRELVHRVASPSFEDDADREAALAELRALAAGDPARRGTQEAVFALAGYLLRRDGAATPRAQEMVAAAATLYPDDPRLPGLLQPVALALADAGDRFGAHLCFLRLLRDPHPPPDGATRAVAADNAARLGEMQSAFAWSTAVSHEELTGPVHARLHASRLIAAEALGRYDEAKAAADELAGEFPERFHADPDALLAAARVDEAAGREDRARERYRRFANVHPASPARPAVLLALGRLHLRAGRLDSARRAFEWLYREHAEAPEATHARLDLLERALPDPAAIPRYVEAALLAGEGNGARLVCRRLLERLLGGGYPLEAVAALAGLARDESEGRLAALAAREVLHAGVGPALALLASRGDRIGVAAAASATLAAGIPIPEAKRPVVNRARAALGLPPLPGGLVELALEQAEAPLRAARWDEVREALEDALRLEPRPDPDVLARATLTLAHALWMTDRDDDALLRIQDALAESGVDPGLERRLRVLRADVLYAGGRATEACREYRRAQRTAESDWVAGQLTRCARIDSGSLEEEG